MRVTGRVEKAVLLDFPPEDINTLLPFVRQPEKPLLTPEDQIHSFKNEVAILNKEILAFLFDDFTKCNIGDTVNNSYSERIPGHFYQRAEDIFSGGSNNIFLLNDFSILLLDFWVKVVKDAVFFSTLKTPEEIRKSFSEKGFSDLSDVDFMKLWYGYNRKILEYASKPNSNIRIVNYYNGYLDSLKDVFDYASQKGGIVKNYSEKLEQENQNLLNYIQILNDTLGKYEERIYEIENSRLWKVKNFIDKVRFILTSPCYAPGKRFKFLQRVNFLLSNNGRKVILKALKIVRGYTVNFFTGRNVQTEISSFGYKNPTLQNNLPSSIEEQKNILPLLPYQPLVSVVVPVLFPESRYIEQTLTSVLNQAYENFEIVLVHPAYKEPGKIIRKYSSSQKFRILKAAGNDYSSLTNIALRQIKGDYVCVVKQNDLLEQDALFQFLIALNKNPQAELVYSDESIIGKTGKVKSVVSKFKFSPEVLLNYNIIGNSYILKTSTLRKVGFYNKEFNNSYEYDLFLRISEETSNILYLPKTCYKRRKEKIKDSELILENQVVVSQALQRRGEGGQAEYFYPGVLSVKYPVKEYSKISIVIPAKDKAAVLEKCLESIKSKTTYPDYEIVVVDNGSTESDFKELIEKWENQEQVEFHCYGLDIPFNFSKLINFGAQHAKGDFLVLLNNDTEVITPEWLELMLGQAQREKAGIVGVKLLFPNNTIQHAGITLNEENIAYHDFMGENGESGRNSKIINSSRDSLFLTAACIMCSKKLFQQVNGFDESFAVECNDLDFCLKVKKAGYKNLYLPYVSLYHYESLSRGNPYINSKSLERHINELEKFRNKWTIKESYNWH